MPNIKLEFINKNITVNPKEEVNLEVLLTENNISLDKKYIHFKLNDVPLKNENQELLSVLVKDGIASVKYRLPDEYRDNDYKITAVYENENHEKFETNTKIIIKKDELNSLNFKKEYEEEFFVIDSDNLENVENHLYGFEVNEDRILINENTGSTTYLTSFGTYVRVNTEDNLIYISQDYVGSYGLYLFKKEDYFAISNSFIKLVEYLKDKYSLSVNFDFAKTLLAVDLSSFSINETLINEITIIPNNYIILIKKDTKILSYTKNELDYNTIPIDTKEGLQVLDSWFERWVNIIRNLKANTDEIYIDLSGGFDTRILFTLILSSNIDLNRVKIISIKDDKHTHKEDYEIASQIAKKYDFNIISEKNYPKRYDDVTSILNKSLYVKLGFHKQMNFYHSKSVIPIFSITGSAGGCIRNHWQMPPTEFIDMISHTAKIYSSSLIKPTQNVAKRALKQVQELNNLPEDSIDIPRLLYRYGRLRNHFGKLSVEKYLANIYTINPLIDPDIHKLKSSSNCIDHDLIMAVIFIRYYPSLLDIKIEGNRSINSETIDYAKEINEKYPYIPKEYSFISEPTKDDLKNIDMDIEETNEPNPPHHPEKVLKEVFTSTYFEKIFTAYFDSQIYYNILKFVEDSNYFPIQYVMGAIAVVKIISSCVESQNYNNNIPTDWFKNILNTKYITDTHHYRNALLLKYTTARIDIKNSRKDNKISILKNSDVTSEIKHPSWFNDDEGCGVVIQSNKGVLDLICKCVGDGNLTIVLRSMDYRDVTGKRIPIYIDYKEFKVNDNKILPKSQLISHDESFTYNKSVKNNEIVRIHLEWSPISSETKL